MPARLWLSAFPLLLLGGCKKEASEKKETPPPPISYNRDVRPLFAENCLRCHSAASQDSKFLLNLARPSIPKSFTFPHPHEPQLTQEEQDTITLWIKQGRQIDQHWSTTPLTSAPPLPSADPEWAVTEIDLFILSSITEPPAPLEIPRTPPSLKHEPTSLDEVPAFLAGDIIAKPESIPASTYLRQGEDTPHHRLHSTTQRFLGLNLECAQCHDHPSLSFSAEDHSHLLALFTTPYDGAPEKNPLRPPTYFPDLPDFSINQILKTELSANHDKLKPHFQEWLKQRRKVPLIRDLEISFSFNSPELDNLALSSSPGDTETKLELASGFHRTSIQFSGEDFILIPQESSPSEHRPLTYSFWFKTGAVTGNTITLLQQGTYPRGFTLRVKDGYLESRLNRYWPGNAIGVRTTEPLEFTSDWNHLAYSFDGFASSDSMRLYLNGLPLATERTGGQIIGPVFEDSPTPLQLGGPATKPWFMDEFQKYSRALSQIEIQHLSDGKALATALTQKTPDTNTLWPYFQGTHSRDHFRIPSTLLPHYASHYQSGGSREIPVMAAIKVPAREHAPKLVSPLAAQSRLDYAKKLTSEQKPLLARATINHLWQLHFGEPLAPHGLGYTGSKPKLLPLLDWLAFRLIQAKWQLEPIAALIQQSRIYTSEYPLETEEPPVCPRPILMKPKIRR